MSKESLLAELSVTRLAIARDTRAVKHELDLQDKLKKVVRSKPLFWFGGAAALGWLLAGPKTKTRVVTRLVDAKGKKVKTSETAKAAKGAGRLGLLISLAKFAFPYLKPTLSSFASRQLSQRMGN